jgi:hypothetical protein
VNFFPRNQNKIEKYIRVLNQGPNKIDEKNSGQKSRDAVSLIKDLIASSNQIQNLNSNVEMEIWVS